jgi:hypothetical protein
LIARAATYDSGHGSSVTGFSVTGASSSARLPLTWEIHSDANGLRRDALRRDQRDD